MRRPRESGSASERRASGALEPPGRAVRATEALSLRVRARRRVPQRWLQTLMKPPDEMDERAERLADQIDARARKPREAPAARRRRRARNCRAILPDLLLGDRTAAARRRLRSRA